MNFVMENNLDIKLLVMDVDGTLTDGKIYMGESGELCKAFNVKDGYGIKELLPRYGINTAIITGRTSQILEKRCEELNINFLYQGISNKIDKLNALMSTLKIFPENVAFIGDDLNDLECMRYVSFSGCPADSVKQICDISDFVSSKKGGEGAVREFIDYIVRRKEKEI